MEAVKTLLCVGVCVSAWSITTAGNSIPTAKNVHWMSVDFTTILKWTVQPSDNLYSVLYSEADGDWTESHDCSEMSGTECDLTTHLWPLDRNYQADIKTEDPDYDLEDVPHTYSPHFNPYRASNISAVKFTVQEVDVGTATVNITDSLTAIHKGGKPLSIRDILKKDLQYKISYYKSDSTRKRDVVTQTSVTNVTGLDAGQSYCFMVAAYIPSRPKATQHGAWSTQQCIDGHRNIVQDLSLEAWVGIFFVLLVVLVIIVVVTLLCYRCRHQKNKPQTSQTSAPV
ncbi:tissue factor-like [Melanotaenia boesemani]|uniref:tissue factor-like n=1 Tax=Melanotaenia boesemani TaxID=1250792 RepID=UPI001C049197|nr:tissue factor-like [Melanotaenia boesemani]